MRQNHSRHHLIQAHLLSTSIQLPNQRHLCTITDLSPVMVTNLHHSSGSHSHNSIHSSFISSNSRNTLLLPLIKVIKIIIITLISTQDNTATIRSTIIRGIIESSPTTNQNHCKTTMPPIKRVQQNIKAPCHRKQNLVLIIKHLSQHQDPKFQHQFLRSRIK